MSSPGDPMDWSPTPAVSATPATTHQSLDAHHQPSSHHQPVSHHEPVYHHQPVHRHQPVQQPRPALQPRPILKHRPFYQHQPLHQHQRAARHVSWHLPPSLTSHHRTVDLFQPIDHHRSWTHHQPYDHHRTVDQHQPIAHHRILPPHQALPPHQPDSPHLPLGPIIRKRSHEDDAEPSSPPRLMPGSFPVDVAASASPASPARPAQSWVRDVMHAAKRRCVGVMTHLRPFVARLARLRLRRRRQVPPRMTTSNIIPPPVVAPPPSVAAPPTPVVSRSVETLSQDVVTPPVVAPPPPVVAPPPPVVAPPPPVVPLRPALKPLPSNASGSPQRSPESKKRRNGEQTSPTAFKRARVAEKTEEPMPTNKALRYRRPVYKSVPLPRRVSPLTKHRTTGAPRSPSLDRVFNEYLLSAADDIRSCIDAIGGDGFTNLRQLLDAPPAPHTPPAPVAASSPPAVSSSPPAVSSSPAAPSPPAAPLPQLIDLDEGQNGRRLPSVPVIRALDQEWDDKVDTALRAAPSKELAMTTDGQELRRRDFETVVPRGNGVADGWVNDEIINAYLQALTRYGNEKTRTHSRNKGVVPRYAAFTTFFYSRLAEKGVEGLQRWAARLKIEGKKLLEVEHLFIPVHLGVHWTLAVVSGKTRTIEYFDSLGGPHGRHTTLIRGWVASELKDAFVDAEWTTLDAQSPRQGNSRDCGVFAITTAKMIMMDVDPMAVRPGDIPLQRRRVVAELLNGGFVGGFALDSQADGLRAAEEEEEEGDDTYVEGEDSSEDKDSSDSDGGSDDRCVSEEEFAVRYQTDEEEPALGSSSSGIDDEGEEEEEEEEDEVEEEEGEDEEEGEGAVDGDGIGDFVLGAEHYGDDLEDYEAWDAEADLEL